ncbi:uncharacterized protein LOC126846397 [Adelges cooleyi]|uniref:uncharacterized protein LOC126846397 n=1 Tax=Adelges cooleyi TaxID=133065 RepID=UPI00217F9EF8|nr:uncharacterized protein LOC126846397 [Adelges cooleyi]
MASRRWQTTCRCVVTVSAILVSAAVGIAGKGVLKLLKLDVPRWVDLRSSATLNCHFDTGGDSLYSVKWYKDEHEFFRYTPELNPKTLVFGLDGIHVDEEKSSANTVVLYPLTRNSNGNYKCEVSTDAPNFPTVVEESNLTVIALPEDGPRLDGVRDYYNIGEYLEANCSAIMTYPAATVTWFVNGIEVDSLLRQNYLPEKSEGPFFNTTVALRYPLKKEWVDMNKMSVDVKCTVKVADADVMVEEKKVKLRSVADHTLSQERHIYNSGAVITNYWMIVFTAFISHCFKAYN